MEDLREMFHSTFEALTANTPELLDAVYRLRYQVYCVETGFEKEKCFPDGRERDAFDAVSEHGLILKRNTRWPVATTRLVRPCLRPGLVFPMEQCYPGFLASHGYGPERLPFESTAEISRFAISNVFKRRPGEAGTLTGASEKSLRIARSTNEIDRRHFPHIILGLFYLITQLSVEAGVTHWVAAMEPALLRLLGRFAIEFVPLGDPIDYHGLRQPCVARVDDVIRTVYRRRPDVWELGTDAGTLWAPSRRHAESGLEDTSRRGYRRGGPMRSGPPETDADPCLA